ncbi:energy-coupling factor transporter transmembrane component T family protein [Candidatus Mycoplasma mahonii]|uniref:energy-coupling factor transporter transmembrane component T family protein n=1 Tax=Candidatus Mycoplasma mahonii TaxID=3004105 RepID=UPI0026F00262|nr:energy-coupling factor transporter transmembrane protein EcfT [Candidatus Mycoplasma mahonii]WKX02307.1 energy-coupling factor transporter transmembrane protein EcfT [Candidatus Mycoplasma mahonii]
MKNISVGKYVPGNSFIHKMDPRIKIMANIIIIVLVFLAKSFISQAIIISPIFFAFLISGLRKRQLFSILKPAFFIGTFLFIINIFIMSPLKPGLHPELPTTFEITWWIIAINYPVVYQTLIITLRIYIMILTTTLLTSTTKPMGMTKGIEDLLLPLKLVKVPVHIIAMIISIALRFIPTLLEEAQRIMKAQSSRGVDFKNGGLKSKSKSMTTLIIPLFVSAFSKAEDLGNAMETRGYDPYKKRTRYRQYKLTWRDAIGSFFLIGLIIYVAFLNNNVFVVPYWWTY